VDGKIGWWLGQESSAKGAKGDTKHEDKTDIGKRGSGDAFEDFSR